MTDSDATTLARATRACVVAPAGCGKTDLIARSVRLAYGRQLVLTHTNAGVEALLRRLRREGVGPEQGAVDTIHGWCLKFLSSYPSRTGGVPQAAKGLDWNAMCTRMTQSLGIDCIRAIVRASYSGIFVDEYQDCMPCQHELVSALSQLLPTRVLGDPMQGIFRFETIPPPWSDVELHFPRVLTLATPWRWQRDGHNAALGRWLAHARQVLQAGGDLCLGDSPVRHLSYDVKDGWGNVVQECCFDLGRMGGTIAAILKWQQDFRRVGQMTGGYFQSVEPIEASDGAAFLSRLEAASEVDRTRVTAGFLGSVANVADESDDMQSILTRCSGETGLRSPEAIAKAIDQALVCKAVKAHRGELLRACLDALRSVDQFGGASLVDRFRARRSAASRAGRRLATRVCGSTLLLKGMEFDHAIVVDCGTFSEYEWYVALTRGSKSLTVVSPCSTLTFSGVA